jgi:hypothetical protein
VVRRVGAAAFNAYRHSQYDATDLWRLIDATSWERGTQFHRDCVYNDVGAYARPAPEELVAGDPEAAVRAVAQTQLGWVPAEHQQVLHYFAVRGLQAASIDFTLWTDRRYIPDDEVVAFLYGVERLLVAGAGRDVPLAEMEAVTGIAPVVRGPGWVRVDSCWVELAAVARLLEELPGVRRAWVSGAPGALTAYVVPQDATGTPHTVHAACMAALAGRYAVMAPQRYVLCDAIPDRLPAGARWSPGTVLAEGSGRL